MGSRSDLAGVDALEQPPRIEERLERGDLNLVLQRHLCKGEWFGIQSEGWRVHGVGI